VRVTVNCSEESKRTDGDSRDQRGSRRNKKPVIALHPVVVVVLVVSIVPVVSFIIRAVRVAEMAVGAQIDTSERETGSAKIPLLNGDQVHEATKVTGQYRSEILTRGTTRTRGCRGVTLRLIRWREPAAL